MDENRVDDREHDKSDFSYSHENHLNECFIACNMLFQFSFCNILKVSFQAKYPMTATNRPYGSDEQNIHVCFHAHKWV